MSMAVEKAFNIEYISERACAYNIHGESFDGNDFFEVYDAVSRAAERARAGDGPSLLESRTYRWKGHSRSDSQAYRTRDEVKEWQEKDPIPRFANALKKHELLDDEQFEQLKAEADERIEEALEFAESSPEPAVETIMEGLYA